VTRACKYRSGRNRPTFRAIYRCHAHVRVQNGHWREFHALLTELNATLERMGLQRDMAPHFDGIPWTDLWWTPSGAR